MNTAVIITKEPGQLIDKGYLTEALKNCPTCFGITIQDLVDKEPLLDTSAEHRNISADDLYKIVENCKDLRMVIHLGKMGKDFDPETDLQPFVFQQAVEGEDPQDILSFSVEGDLPNYSKPGGGHTDEYHFWENLVFPTLLEKLQASPDLADFYQRIRASSFEQTLMNAVNHRAVFVFVPLEGDIIAFGRNDIGGKFDWGTTSNTFGWGGQSKLEAAAEVAVATAKKAGSRLQRLMGSTAPAPEPVKQEPEKKENPPGVHNVPEKTGGADPFAMWPGTSSKTHTMFTVPNGLQGNARNRWIRLFTNNPNGDLPKGKDREGFQIPVANKLIGYAQEDVSTNDDVKILAATVKKFQSSGAVASVSDQMKEANNETSHPQQVQKPASQPAGSTRPTSDFLPESPAEEAKIATELVTEWATNPKAPTALEVQRIESKWPLFTVSRGITLANVARWSIAEKKDFAKKCPNDAARLISELVLKLHEYGAFEQVNTEHQNDKGGDKSVQPQPDTSPQPGGTSTKKTSRLQRLTAA